jgi:hypothetical protein
LLLCLPKQLMNTKLEMTKFLSLFQKRKEND